AAVAAHPDDLEARGTLLAYYQGRFAGPDAALAVRNHERHALWVIEHRPASGVAGSPFVMIPRWLDPEGYARGKALWLAWAAGSPPEPLVLLNAATYLGPWEPDEARALLRQGRALEPRSPIWPHRLGLIDLIQARDARDPADGAALGRSAFRELKDAEA